MHLISRLIGPVGLVLRNGGRTVDGIGFGVVVVIGGGLRVVDVFVVGRLVAGGAMFVGRGRRRRGGCTDEDTSGGMFVSTVEVTNAAEVPVLSSVMTRRVVSGLLIMSADNTS